jgi:small subunit ribosomal protein S9
MATINAIGRRKTSVARVYLKAGQGKIMINDRPSDEFLEHSVLRMKVRRPFEVVGLQPEAFEINVNVNGGGINGQTEAIRLGISRALEKFNPDSRCAKKRRPAHGR